jgi:hypothetical protein
MAITLLESVKGTKDYLRSGVIKIIVESSPILQFIKMKTINSSAYRYMIEAALPNVAFRGVNSTWTRSAGVINPQAEFLSIMGGEITVDNFQINTEGNIYDLKAKQYELFSRSMAINFSQTFFEGDTNIDPNSFDGLRRRITGNQLQVAGSPDGGDMNLSFLDQLFDSVIGDAEGKHAFLNKTLRRRITYLARNVSGTAVITTDKNEFGAQVTSYAGVPLHVVERSDDASTILDFDETVGANNTTASLYVARFGNEDFVFGIQGQGGDIQVRISGKFLPSLVIWAEPNGMYQLSRRTQELPHAVTELKIPRQP